MCNFLVAHVREEKTMIARTWKALAAADKVKDYVAHFEKHVYPDLQQIAGFRGAYVMQKPQGDGVEIQVMTLWETMASIHTFAGETLENAVIEPESRADLRS